MKVLILAMSKETGEIIERQVYENNEESIPGRVEEELDAIISEHGQVLWAWRIVRTEEDEMQLHQGFSEYTNSWAYTTTTYDAEDYL